MVSTEALAQAFPRYDAFAPLVPTFCVSRSGRPTIHRFYDTSPMSPSGRYIAVTELPYEDHLPLPGDLARVVVIDLQSGQETYASETAAWDTQVGAHAQWGADDAALFFNRLDRSEWRPYGVRVDFQSGSECALDLPVYMVSIDGRQNLTPCLRRIGLVQAGYGVALPDRERPRNIGAPEDDGVFILDTATGKGRLLVSLADIADLIRATVGDFDRSPGGLYGFHVKWNSDSSRVMCIVRWLRAGALGGRTLNFLVTFRPDGTDRHVAVTAARWRGGHHPNWCPDGQDIVMNLSAGTGSGFGKRVSGRLQRLARKVGVPLRPGSTSLRFTLLRYDGSEERVIVPEHPGSGHPTIDPRGKLLLSDAYVTESVAFADGTVPLRLIDLATSISRTILRVPCRPKFAGPDDELRIDPHPAWDASGRRIAFNAAYNGVRAVYVADLSAYII